MTVGGAAIVRRRNADRRAVAGVLLLLVATIVFRFAQIGNPLHGLDEQYYLLVGARMWDGALPYVDLWDRKPFGLFALFALFHLGPGNGVVTAQLTAAFFTFATACIVAIHARRSSGNAAATMAGIVYLAGTNALWGETTQTPVFYNLLIGIAALATLDATRAVPSGLRWRPALVAMLLAGLAIQIKTTAAIEGGFLGLWLVLAAWRRCRDVMRVLRIGTLLAVTGALPTLLVMLLYAALGHFDAWWQANVLSILAKGAPLDAEAIGRLGSALALLAPVALLAVLGLARRTIPGDRLFLIGWIVAATIGFVAIGGFWPHYALPLLLPLSIAAAPAFARRPTGPMLFVVAIAAPLFQAVEQAPREAAGDRAVAARVLAALPADVRTRCLFLYEGPVAYYHLSRACLVTPFAFTAHLRSAREGMALGVDPHVALRRALDRRPGTIVTVERSRWGDRDPVNDGMIADRLAADYAPIARLPVRHHGQGERLLIWRRRDLPNGRDG